jgi:hypothetical protein
MPDNRALTFVQYAICNRQCALPIGLRSNHCLLPIGQDTAKEIYLSLLAPGQAWIFITNKLKNTQ